MKKKIIKFNLPLAILILLTIILGFVFLFIDVYDGPTKTISGEISLFDKGGTGRGRSPMHIKIDNETYIITYGVRWATNHDELKDTLSVGNIVTIEFYEEANMKYVVGIEHEGNVLVTKKEYIEAQNEQNKLRATIYFYIAYTLLLINIMLELSFSGKFGFDYNLGYLNEVTLFKGKHMLNIFISVLLIIGSFAAIGISKWLYFPTITIALAYLFYTITFNGRVYFGTGGFRILIRYKKKHYGWNAIKEMIQVNYKNKKVVVINFKENYNFESNDINEYLSLSKKQNNKFVYILYLTKEKSKEFDKLQNKYYKKS
ncbi:MAG: hypothetical protein IJX78_02090 [Bacilli bacterium]|nr:hypothetical protein [Bacilli bacterium]